MGALVEQYTGEAGREALVEALRGMVLVNNSQELAEELAEHVDIVFTNAESTLIEEGDEGSDMFFLLSGQLQVIVGERDYAHLRPGAHVGEFSLVDPRTQRSATVRALEDSVTARLSEAAFAKVANRHPDLWRSISKFLGSHVRAVNQFLTPSNPRPRVLICASPLGSPFAQAIETLFTDREHPSEEWTVEVICPEEHDSPGALEEAFAGADLGVIVVAPGDADSAGGGRDRVFHHCGVGVGSLGRARTLLLEPRGFEDQSPAIALGLPCFTYRLDPPEAIKADIDAICQFLREAIAKVGSK